MDSVYDLYRRGCELLDHGDYQAAIVPLTRARDLEPDKASIREALGRALFHAQRYEGAAAEFEAVAAQRAHERLRAVLPGPPMQLLGRHREACQPLALACSLRPERARLPALSRPRRVRDRRSGARSSAARRGCRADAMLDATAFVPA